MGKEKKGKSKRSAKRLFFREFCLGEITDFEGDFPWMYGKLSLTREAAPFHDFFKWMADEENSSKEPPFDEALLDEDNWFIEDDGKRVAISLPAVHEEGLIAWRWR